MNSKLNKRTLELEAEKGKEGASVTKAKGWKRGKKKKFSMKNPFKGVTSNPIDVHMKNPQIVKDLFNIPFNHMIGFPLKLDPSGTAFSSFGTLKTIIYDWFAGVSNDFRSFLNTASTNRWTFIRSRNAGAVNYQASDTYINSTFAAVDIIINLQILRRIFGLKSVFSVFNRLVPKMLIEANGVDYEDFVENIANYRGRYNILAAKASALVIPKLNYIDYALSFFQGVYKDRDSVTGREQLYMVIKATHHIFDPTGDPNGGSVRLMTYHDLGYSDTDADKRLVLTMDGLMANGGRFNKQKLSFWLDIVEAQLNAVITDEDCNIMFGDMIKAYGDSGNFYKPTVLAEDFEIVPQYSEEFLVQHHNANLLSFPPALPFNATDGLYALVDSTYVNTVKQDGNGYIITDLQLTNQANNLDRLYLDTNDANPSPEKVLLMTRWKNSYINASTKVLGPALMFKGYIYISDINSGTGQIKMCPDEQFTTINQGTTIAQMPMTTAFFNALVYSTNFDWDLIRGAQTQLSGTLDPEVRVIGDINNIITIDKLTLSHMHDVDFASLYDVPFSGNF